MWLRFLLSGPDPCDDGFRALFVDRDAEQTLVLVDRPEAAVWSLENAFTSAVKELEPVSRLKAAGRLAPFIARIPAIAGSVGGVPTVDVAPLPSIGELVAADA